MWLWIWEQRYDKVHIKWAIPALWAIGLPVLKQSGCMQFLSPTPSLLQFQLRRTLGKLLVTFCALSTSADSTSSCVTGLLVPTVRAQRIYLFFSGSFTLSTILVSLSLPLSPLPSHLCLCLHSVSLSIQEHAEGSGLSPSWRWPWVAFMDPVLFPLHYERQPSLFMDHP